MNILPGAGISVAGAAEDNWCGNVLSDITDSKVTSTLTSRLIIEMRYII